MSSDIETASKEEEEEEEIYHSYDHHDDEGPSGRAYDDGGGGASEMISEIKEEERGELWSDVFEINTAGLPLATIKEEVTESLFSFDFENWRDVVYVVVGKSEEASMDALLWALSQAVCHHHRDDPADACSTVVFLIHVFPEIKQIPTLLGMMPIDQANPVHQEIHLAQERAKRREYLQKFVNVCSASKVEVETILLESNAEARAILDLIPILNIRKLVVGTSKRNIKSRKIIGTAGQILKGAPEYCEVKVICEGEELVDLMAESLSSRPSSVSPTSVLDKEPGLANTHPPPSLLSCGSCFKPRVD